jgi:hypothetical protein
MDVEVFVEEFVAGVDETATDRPITMVTTRSVLSL